MHPSADPDDAALNLYGLDQQALSEAMERFEAPRFHGKQIHRWLYHRQVWEPEAWTDLPVALRRRLGSEARVDPGRIVDRAVAADGTVKFRTRLPGGGDVETVYMPYEDRVTLCISSQVGCALDCKFCLTGKMGFDRHLTMGEIVGQVALAIRDQGPFDVPMNIVFMGMGEPLHNYDGVLAAFRLLNDPGGFGMSRQRITVSTSGLVPAIERLAEEPRRPRLAVSLNASNDAVRDRIMPVNRKYPIARLLEACRTYSRRTGDRFTLEYVLLAGINDHDDDIDRLAGLTRPLACKVNLIPFNAVEGWLPYRPPDRPRVLEWRDRLLAKDVAVSVRWSRGSDSRAACGQLAVLPGESEATA